MSARADVRKVVRSRAPKLAAAELRYLRAQSAYPTRAQNAFDRGETQLPNASSTAVAFLRAWRSQARAAQDDLKKLGDSKARKLALQTYRDLDSALTAQLPTMAPGPNTRRQLAVARRGYARYRRSLKSMNKYLS